MLSTCMRYLLTCYADGQHNSGFNQRSHTQTIPPNTESRPEVSTQHVPSTGWYRETRVIACAVCQGCLSNNAVLRSIAPQRKPSTKNIYQVYVMVPDGSTLFRW